MVLKMFRQLYVLNGVGGAGRVTWYPSSSISGGWRV